MNNLEFLSLILIQAFISFYILYKNYNNNTNKFDLKFNNDLLISLFTGILIFLIDKTNDIIPKIFKKNKELLKKKELENIILEKKSIKIIKNKKFLIFLVFIIELYEVFDNNKDLIENKTRLLID